MTYHPGVVDQPNLKELERQLVLEQIHELERVFESADVNTDTPIPQRSGLVKPLLTQLARRSSSEHGESGHEGTGASSSTGGAT